MDARQTIQSLNEEIDLARLVRTVWRGKFRIILWTILFLSAGGYYAFNLAVPHYTTTANVVQKTDQEPVVDFSAGLGGDIGGGADQSAINTEIEVLRSRELLEKLVNELRLVEDPEFNPELAVAPMFSVASAIDWITQTLDLELSPEVPLSDQQVLDEVVNEVRKVLSVSNIRQSYVFNISVVTKDAEKSALMANTLAELYIINQLDVKSEANNRAMIWLTERVNDLRIELESAETKVKEFSAATDLINEETLAALNRQVKELRERLIEEKEKEANNAAILFALRSVENDPQQMANIADDRLLTSLLDELTDDSQQDRQSFDRRFEQIIQQRDVEGRRLATQIAALEQSILQQELATDQQSDDFLALQQLEREAAASGLLYEFFLSRLKETSVQSGVQEADSRVLSRAVVQLEASSPRRGFILVVSVLLGGLWGVSSVVLKEFRQSTYRAAEELEAQTGMTVLGQVPKIPAGKRAKVLKYLTDKPTSAAAEAIRNLRTSILLSDPDNPPQVIMSTSSIPGEGKTTQSLALAQNLAGLNKKVLLIEGDIRKLVFAQYFNIRSENGLLSVLDGRAKIEDAAVFDKSLNADVLIGEKSSQNAADLFSGDAFKDFIHSVRTKYDYIIIDTPPVLAVPDARVIGRIADSIVYTVRWDKTTRRQVAEGLKSFQTVGVEVTGLVLSQVNPKGQRRYGYGDMAQSYGSYHEN